ncbi:hypothetical protein D3C83_209370 [compost metagenome]
MIAQFIARRPYLRESFDDQLFRDRHGFAPDEAFPEDPHHALVQRRNLRACLRMITDIQAEKLLERY